MPDMKYRTSDLRTGGAHAASASQSAGNAAAALGGAGGGSPFGNVNGADSLHAAVGQARDHHQVHARNTATNMNSASERADLAARLGDENTVDTTAAAPRMAR